MLRISRWIVHPVIFSVYPVLFYYSQNTGQVAFESVLKPGAIILLCALPGWWLLQFITRDWYRAGGILSLFLLLFFSYGHARTNVDLSSAAYLLPLLWMLLFLLGVVAIARNPFENATKMLNVAALLMLTLVLVDIGRYAFSADSPVYRPAYSRGLSADDATGGPANHGRPDIYFIVLDAYAREDVLREVYGYDNSDFLDFLKSRGFYVADKAIANYGQTVLSLGSSLNLDYAEKWTRKPETGSAGRIPLNSLIQQSRALNFFRGRGYGIIAFAATARNMDITSADVYLNSGMTMEGFYAGLLNSTPLPDIFRSEQEDDDIVEFRRHTLFMFDKLGELAAEFESPKFVYAYFKLPHPPFVFDADGEPIRLESRFDDHDGDWLIRPGRLSLQQYRNHYTDQVRFANRNMKRVITQILGGSTEPPIIILFGDHGPRSGLVWDSAEESDLKESLTILNAYHLPGDGSALLYPEISPVNTFRVILNHYFGADLELLPDRSYFSTANNLSEFKDVTDRVTHQSSR